jgi:hypothetical protein
MTHYLTSRQLGIKPWERRGLIAFIKAAPTMKHNPTPNHTVKPGDDGLVFNMSFPLIAAECGTVCCIGGFVWVQEHGAKITDEHCDHGFNRNTADYVYNTVSKLYALYFPHLHNQNWGHIKPTAAAKVVEHFLFTGEIKWDLVA